PGPSPAASREFVRRAGPPDAARHGGHRESLHRNSRERGPWRDSRWPRWHDGSIALLDVSLLRTSLFEKHVELGAKIVPFAGWEMPVQYEGVREEHLAVRTHAGMFDVSHMGEVEVEGPGALAFLQRVLSNDVAAIEIGGAQYSCLCNEDGGVLDDLFAYRLGGERSLLVTNSANHQADLAWLGRWS